MIPRPRLRPPGTRTVRSDPHQRRLESLAAEFALLTQRRARTMLQVQMLDQQRAAASENLHRVQARIAWLAQRMDLVDPSLRDSQYQVAPEPAPPPAPSWLLKPSAALPPPRVAAKAAATATPARPSLGKASLAQRWLAAKPARRPRTIGNL